MNILGLLHAQYSLCKRGERKNKATDFVNAVKSQDPPGRFLELDSKSGCWNLVSDERARDKKCQSLRDGRSGFDYEYPSMHSKKRSKRSRCSYLAKMIEVSIVGSPKTSEIIPSLKNTNVASNLYEGQVSKQADSVVSMPSMTSSRRKSRQELNFADYDGVLLANLQTFCAKERNCPSVIDNNSPCGNNLPEIVSSDTPSLSSEDASSQSTDCEGDSSNYLLKVDDKFELDILTSFLDLDEDSAITGVDSTDINYA